MKNQKAEILALLQSRPNQWIPVYEIARIALQYGSRLKELRETCSKCGKKGLEIGETCSCGGSGYDIENKILEVVNGQKHTAFRLNVSTGQYQERFYFAEHRI